MVDKEEDPPSHCIPPTGLQVPGAPGAPPQPFGHAKWAIRSQAWWWAAD